jgi:hypothetical protein
MIGGPSPAPRTRGPFLGSLLFAAHALASESSQPITSPGVSGRDSQNEV